MTASARDAGSLILSAPLEEASFLSLPYVEALLCLYRCSVFVDSPDSPYGAARGTDAEEPPCGRSAPTRLRLEAERRAEEYYFEDRPAPADARALRVPSSPLAALLLLRRGLGRALGLCDLPVDTEADDDLGGHAPSPAPAEATSDDWLAAGDVADHLLSRRRYTAATSTTLAGYCEESEDDLRRTAFTEWFEDLLGFLVARDYSVVQARCVLVDAVGLLECLDALPADAVAGADADDVVARAASDALRSAITAQACALPTPVLTTVVTREPVVRELPDPAQRAALERQLATDKKLSKKQQVALQERINSVPLVSQTVLEQRRTQMERQETIGPYFTLPETAAVLGYLTESLLAHWRLVKHCRTTEQQQQQELLSARAVRPTAGVGLDGTQAAQAVVYEDIEEYCVPPLAAFLPAEQHAEQTARRELFAEARSEATALYEAEFAGPIAQLRAAELAERSDRQTAEDATAEVNRKLALSPEEYARVQRAYTLRLQLALPEREADAVPASSTPLPPGSPAAAAAATTTVAPPAAATVATSSGLPPLLSGEPRVLPETVTLPPGAADRFQLPEVEARVAAVATSLDAALSDGRLAKKAKGKR